MSPEVSAVTSDFYTSKNLQNKGSRSGSFLNSTFESSSEDQSDNFALKCNASPARITIDQNDDEIGADSEIDESDVSLRSLGLDFV